MTVHSLDNVESMLADQLDELLFLGPYTLIDEDNRGAGSAPTRAAAEAAVETSRAATYAGRIRPDVTAIDVDVDHGGLGDYLVDELRTWARSRNLWCVSRESGGGGGRRHVFVRPERFSGELARLVDLLRDERRLTSAQLDVRTVIRPLTAPHRRTGDRLPPADLDRSTIETARAWPHAASAPRRRTTIENEVPAAGAAVLSSRVRDTIATAVAQATGDRSVDEFALTRHLHDQGEDQATTWAAVASLSGKAAGRGHRWWHKHMWQRVRPSTASPDHVPTVDLAQLILPTVAAMRPRMGGLDVRRQHTIEDVCWAVLERLQAAQEDWVPLSERDVQLATGHDRKTLRWALTWLREAGVLGRRQSARADDAQEWHLGPSVVQALNPPPCLTPCAQTWLPGAPAGTASHVLDHHLTAPPNPDSPAPRQLSSRQRRLHAERNQVAQAQGLVTTLSVNEDQGTAGSTPPGEPDPARAADAGEATPAANGGARGRGWRSCPRRQQILARITAERDRFYERLRAHRRERQDSWLAQRQAAYTAARDRQRRWWRALSADERDRRRRCWRDRHAQLGSDQRCQRVERLRRRRAIAAGAGRSEYAAG